MLAAGSEDQESATMSLDFLLGGATFLGLLAYLLFALVRGERF
jgi:hypothetical protein